MSRWLARRSDCKCYNPSESVRTVSSSCVCSSGLMVCRPVRSIGVAARVAALSHAPMEQVRWSADLPLFRRSITPRALTWKSRQQPSSRASTLLTGYFPYL
jgi:hypothetical protein